MAVVEIKKSEEATQNKQTGSNPSVRGIDSSTTVHVGGNERSAIRSYLKEKVRTYSVWRRRDTARYRRDSCKLLLGRCAACCRRNTRQPLLVLRADDVSRRGCRPSFHIVMVLCTVLPPSCFDVFLVIEVIIDAALLQKNNETHTHTHTHTYIYNTHKRQK